MAQHESKLSAEQIEKLVRLPFYDAAVSIGKGFREIIFDFISLNLKDLCAPSGHWFLDFLDDLRVFYHFLDKIEHVNPDTPNKESLLIESFFQLAKRANIVRLNRALQKIYIEQTQEMIMGRYGYNTSFSAHVVGLFSFLDDVEMKVVSDYSPEWDDDDDVNNDDDDDDDDDENDSNE